MTALLHQPGLSEVVAGLLSTMIVVVQFGEERWGRGRETRRKRREIRLQLIKSDYVRRPRKALYALVPRMALEIRMSSRRMRFAARAERVDQIPQPAQAQAEALAREWIGSVGLFARRVATEERLPLRQFLATYHLGLMREGVVAVPIALRLLKKGELTKEESQDLYWGFALVELAAWYNSVARQQRAAVYFAGKPPIGPVRKAPPSGRLVRAGLNLIDLCSPRFRLRRWRYRRCCRFLVRTIPEISLRK